MSEPEWLTRARAEGRVLSERWAGDSASAVAPSPAPAVAEAKAPGAKPTRAQRTATSTRTSTTPGPTRIVLAVEVPIRLVSEANAGGKLGAKIKRKSAVKAAVKMALPKLAGPFPLPATVIITRLGGRELDGDNAIRSAKSVRDTVAEWLGVDDRDKRVRWVVKQAPAWASGVRVKIIHRAE